MPDQQKTTQRKIAIDEATFEQLVSFATNTLGISVKSKAKKEEVLATIKSAWHEDHILLPVTHTGDNEPGSVMGAIPEKPVDQGKQHAEIARQSQDSSGDRMARIVIHEGAGKSGKRPVPVSVNGVQNLIPRGKEVLVPERYVQVLNNAVRTEYEQDPEDHTVMVESQVYAYPFRVVEWIEPRP